MLTRIVQPSPALKTFLESLHLDLSQPQAEHLLHLVDGLLVCDERKTLAALQRQFLDATDPSNWADFLRISPWSVAEVREALRRHQVTWLLELAQARGLPKVLYVNLDDSLGVKDKQTRTSSRSTGSTITTNRPRAGPATQPTAAGGGANSGDSAGSSTPD